MAAQKPIHIVGLGIAGAVLGRCLQARGIPFLIFEKGTETHRYNYSISLQASTYRSLLPVLDLDAKFFRQLCGIDKAQSSSKKVDLSSSLRVNRGDFERVLQEGLDVTWEHKLTDIRKTSGQILTLTFENGNEYESPLVIGADGVHSKVRQFIAPENKPSILSYAAINGKRRIERSSFESISSHFKDQDRINFKVGQTLFQAYVNQYGDKPSISFTYSRPSKGDEDALFKPNRPIAGATEIPDEFFDEVRQYGDLPEPWNAIFDTDALAKDRLLHWLMRKNLVYQDEIQSGLSSNAALVGDALHTMPIIGSYGADYAIQDAMALADVIASNGDLAAFYDGMYETWEKASDLGEKRLDELHEAVDAGREESGRSQL